MKKGGDVSYKCSGATQLQKVYELAGKLEDDNADNAYNYLNDRGIPYIPTKPTAGKPCENMIYQSDRSGIANIPERPIIKYFKSKLGFSSNASNDIVTAYHKNTLTHNDLSVLHKSVFDKLNNIFETKYNSLVDYKAATLWFKFIEPALKLQVGPNSHKPITVSKVTRNEKEKFPKIEYYRHNPLTLNQLKEYIGFYFPFFLKHETYTPSYNGGIHTLWKAFYDFVEEDLKKLETNKTSSEIFNNSLEAVNKKEEIEYVIKSVEHYKIYDRNFNTLYINLINERPIYLKPKDFDRLDQNIIKSIEQKKQEQKKEQEEKEKEPVYETDEDRRKNRELQREQYVKELMAKNGLYTHNDAVRIANKRYPDI